VIEDLKLTTLLGAWAVSVVGVYFSALVAGLFIEVFSGGEQPH